MILSDEKIREQYEGFKVTYISVQERFFKEKYYSGTIEITFPNATHPDFDESVVDNFISYDSNGHKIAFERWYPSHISKKLCELVRNKIKEYQNKI